MPATIWKAQLEHFAAQRRVIAFDPRGQGQSAIGPVDHPPTVRAHDIEDLLREPVATLLAAHVQRTLPPPSHWLPGEVPAVVRCGLDVVLAKACAKDPDDRFASAADMRRALMDVLPG